jgi:hypothetical protein
MKKEDTLLKVENRLASLRLQEHQLQEQMKLTGLRIREGATPGGLLKNAVSSMFTDKNAVSQTAKAALGLGAGLVLNNITRKQRRMSLIGKVAGLAVGAVITGIAGWKNRKS